MAYTLIDHTGKTSGTTTTAINSTGANLLVVAIAVDSGTMANPTDSKTNTWTGLTQTVVGTDTAIKIFYSFGGTVGSSHTFTQPASYGSIFVAAFSGSTSSPFDQQNGNTQASGTSVTTGSVTPTQDNELIIAVADIANTNTLQSIGGGFTTLDTTNGVNGVNYGGIMGYLIQTTATAANPTISWTGTAEAAARIASFKVPAVGGTGQSSQRMMMGMGC